MESLNKESWTKVYSRKMADVFAIFGERRNEKIFQTSDKEGNLTGWRYSNLDAAKKAADEDGM